LTWKSTAGTGTIFSMTVARRPTHPGLADRTPYVIAIVELDEGPRLTTNIVDCPIEDVHIGMQVRVDFEELLDESQTFLPVFKPIPRGPAASSKVLE
jgi:hypothetical protein